MNYPAANAPHINIQTYDPNASQSNTNSQMNSAIKARDLRFSSFFKSISNTGVILDRNTKKYTTENTISTKPAGKIVNLKKIKTRGRKVHLLKSFKIHPCSKFGNKIKNKNGM